MRFRVMNKLVELRSPIKVYNLPNLYTWGITNHTTDNYFVLFLDYDSTEYSVVREDIDFLQKNFDVGTVITRITSEKVNNIVDKEIGNYHVIGFTKYTFPEIRDMIDLTRCDPHFKTGYKYQARCWVLRIGEKKELGNSKTFKKSTELKEVIVSKTTRTANTGLIEFFEKLDGIKLRKYFSVQDKIKEVELIHYVTQKVRHI